MRARDTIVSILVACAACNDPDVAPPPPDDQTRDAGMMMMAQPDASIDPSTLVAIRVTHEGAQTIAPGDTTTLRATGVRRDNSEFDLTNAATWSIDAPAIAEAQAGGIVRAIAAGTANIKATRGDIESDPVQVIV